MEALARWWDAVGARVRIVDDLLVNGGGLCTDRGV
jgi:adenine/guanine phosphoribosyltransferase-like PRPP-binding protein